MLSLLWLICGDALTVSVVFAALIHECGHAAAISLTGGKIQSVTVGFYGAEMTYENTKSYLVEVMRAAAGPMFGVAAALISSRMMPSGEYRSMILLTNLIFSLGNMIPVTPLDGGRILYYLMMPLIGEKGAEKISRWTGFVISLTILVLAFMFCLQTGAVVVLPGAISIMICCCKNLRSGVV